MSIARALPFEPGRARLIEAKAAGTLAAGPVLELVETTAGLLALASQWNALFQRAGRPTHVFQTHAFAETWVRTYLHRPGMRLAILAAWEGGRLVMVWPLVMERSLGISVVSWLGAPIAQYGDALVEPGLRAQSLLESGWAHIQAHLRPDVVRLRKVRADAAVAPLLERIGTRQCCRDEAASVALGACEEAGIATASFEERQSAKARKNRRRLLRRLEEQGEVHFEAHEPSDATARHARQGLVLKRRWLEARGLYSAAFADRRIEHFFEAAAGAGGGPTGCRVFALTLDAMPVAVAIGFVSGPRLTLHMIAYDMVRENCGVGVLNLESILRWAEGKGLTTVDLLAPKAAYKMDWADSTDAVSDHAVASSVKGRACLGLVDGFLRPLAKSALACLPAAVTRRLAGRAC